MKKYISIIEGDGIGPEISKQTVKVLNAITTKFNHKFIYYKCYAGYQAMKKFNTPMPQETIKYCIKSNAVLFGCVGDEKYDQNFFSKVRPEDGLLELRKKLNLYCNIRPIVNYEQVNNSLLNFKENINKKINFLIYRELTGGIYFGKKGRLENGEKAYDCCTYSKYEIQRIANKAFQAACKRKNKVTLVDKSNVLETSKLWREVVINVNKNYPNVILDFLYIDNATIQILTNPYNFDIILTENMFGDILSDEASLITGSIGMLPSASIGLYNALFEPVHGSYPNAKGKNIANPLGSILSVGMMLDYFKMYEENKVLYKAVKSSLINGVCTKDIKQNEYYSTDEVGDYITKYIKNY